MNLRSELPFWLLKNGLTHTFPSLQENLSCDALVVGGGISGALLVHELSARGIDCVLVDRRHIAFGSTSASTGLLQYEIDKPLVELIPLVGKGNAERAYLMGVEAIRYLERVCGKDCGFTRHPSLMIAKDTSHVARLRSEYEARSKAGLDVEWLERPELQKDYGIPRPAAIRSAIGAEVDPYRLTHRLLKKASERGARVFDRTELIRYSQEKRSVVAYTENKFRIRAKRIFFATGYEITEWIPKDIVKISSTYAFVSEPIEDFEWWNQKALLWESGKDYLYARTTSDGRVLIGGEDDELQNGDRRDARVESKTLELARAFQRLMPHSPLLTVAFAWAGAFGHTKDGLAYIGPHESFPRGYFSLGFGGNGITFSAMAAEILADLHQGKTNSDAAIYTFSR